MQSKKRTRTKYKRLAFVAVVAIVVAILLILNKSTNLFSSIAGLNNLTDAVDYDTTVGENAYISSVATMSTVTGTAPFDTVVDTDSSNADKSITWSAGNDASADDNIVRSFDEITWTIGMNLVLKDTATESSYSGGVIELEATVPSEYAGLVNWNLDEMNWIENGTVSSDGTVLTGYYSMSEDITNVPGERELSIPLQLYGITNGKEIVPTFKLSLYGNTDNEVYTYTCDTVYVSSAPSYNIQLKRNDSLSNKITGDLGDGEEVEGRLYGYGIMLQLYNTDTEKGLKGIEYPDLSDITFEIDLGLTRTLENSSTVEDITDECTPILWNYNINYRDDTGNGGNIPNRNMYYSNQYSTFARYCPYGKQYNGSGRSQTTYNSGSVTMEQDGSKIYVTVSGYDFDGTFPNKNAMTSDIDYTDNIGIFSVLYMQILVPFNEASSMTDRTYKLNVSDTNFKMVSSSGDEVISQAVTSDDSNSVEHVKDKVGSYSAQLRVNTATVKPSSYTKGDGAALVGSHTQIWTEMHCGSTNDEETTIYTFNKLLKFDGDCFEPELYNGAYYSTGTAEFTGEVFKYKNWFVTKKDGTNWVSESERDLVSIDDLIFYKNYEDIPDGWICVGEYFESQSGYVTNGYQIIYVNLKIKDTAKIGQTYAVTHDTWAWMEELDRDVYTIDNEDVEWPATTFSQVNLEYIKSEYDDDGNVKSGTHSKSIAYGQSLLIIGSNLTVNENTIDGNGVSKSTYDLGNNEDTVTYQITPNLPNNSDSDAVITGVTLEVTVTIPQGLTYIAGSSNYDEPTVIQNADGTTTLTWYIYNCTVGESIEPIVFNAHISEETENETHYSTTVIIKEAIAGEDEYKVGNSYLDHRTTSGEIIVTNMASYSLFKETETPIIEKDGEIHFRITVLNKTDNSISGFHLLDILPYNDDSRGSSFSGNYLVNKITFTQTNSNTGEEIENDIKLYISESEDARSLTAKDLDISSSIWEEDTLEEVNENLTAIAFNGSLGGREKLEIDIYIETSGNTPGDVYQNNATADINADLDEMETSVITVQVVTRKIDGYVWLDSNGDGLISDGEEYLSNVTVTLLNSDGTEALDVNGNVIAPTVTNENGYYYFENMEKGDYIVKFQSAEEIIDKNYEFTEKEASINKPLTSKVNENGLTDVITSLNNTDSPNLVEEYVNAGIREINIKYITVNKEWVDTEDQKDKRPEKVNFNIYKTDESGNKTGDVVSSYELVTSSETSHTFEVEKYDSNGVDINYVVEETEVNEGDLYFYESEGGVVTEETNETTGDIEYTATITNTFTVPQVEEIITVTKIWDDNEDEAQKRPSSININLNYTENGDAKQESNTLDIASNESECYFTVNKYDENGNEINYIVSEEEVNEDDLKFYSATIGEMTKITDTDYSVQITNKFEVEQEYIEVTAIKNWVYENDTQAKRIPENVSLALVNGDTTVETLEATDSNSWTVIFGESQNVAKYNELGDEIEYTVKEVDDLEFWVSSGEANVQNNDGSYRAEVTNTFTVPSDNKVVQATKVWEDNGLNRPDIVLSLTGESGTYTKTATSANVDSTNSNQWLVDFEVPKYNSNGEDAEYTLSEENISNYITSIDGYTVTNTAIFVDNSIVKTSNTTQITSVNEGIDYTIIYNVDVSSRYTGDVIVTIVDTLPYAINESESSLSGGTYNAENRTITWTGSYNTETKVITWSDGTIENLNSLYLTKEISVVYSNLPVATGTVIENKVQGIASTESGAYIDCSASFEITTNFSIDVNVNKIWVGDSDADRPQEITVKLLATVDGSDYDLTGVDTELTLSTGNNWKDTFTYLPKYDSSYNLIEYTVYEVESEDLNNYYNSIESTQGEGTLNFVVTNSKYGSVTLTKVDNSDNTKLLEGAEFKIEKLDSDENIDESFDAIYKTTDENGKLTFENLTYGEYLITETKAPDDYNLATSSITVEINGDDPDIEVTAYNKHKFNILETGGNGMITLIAISLAILIIGFKVSKPKKVARISLADKRYKEYKKKHKINRNS